MKPAARLLCLLLALFHLGSSMAVSASTVFLHDHSCVVVSASEATPQSDDDLPGGSDNLPACSPPACSPSHAQCGMTMAETPQVNERSEHFDAALADMRLSRTIPVEPHPPR